MSEITLQQRMAEQNLRLSEADTAKFARLVADTEAVGAWLRALPRSYADEPAVVFHAKPR